MPITEDQFNEMQRRTEAARGKKKIVIDPTQEDSTPLPTPVQAAVNEFHTKRTLATPGKRLRQDTKPLMNKLETEWFNILKRQFPNYPTPRPQAKTYKLANGLRYTPDFTASSWPQVGGTNMETAWEVKGSWLDGDSIPKLKMMAAAWPEVQLILVWKDKKYGCWKEQRILP